MNEEIKRLEKKLKERKDSLNQFRKDYPSAYPSSLIKAMEINIQLMEEIIALKWKEIELRKQIEEIKD